MPRVSRTSPKGVHPKIARLIAEFGLTLLRGEALRYSPLQYRSFRHSLLIPRNILFSAETGSGKTLVFIVRSIPHLLAGNRVVFLVTQDDLAEQMREEFLKYTTVDPTDIVTLSGDGDSPAKRHIVHLSKPRITIETREVFLNDVEAGTFDWDRVSIVGSDEVHHAQGDDTYTKLFPLLSKRPEVQLFGMSATAGKDKQSIKWLQHQMGVENRDFIAQPRDQRRVVRNKEITVYLDDELEECANLLREVFTEKFEFLMDQLYRSPALFPPLPPLPSQRFARSRLRPIPGHQYMQSVRRDIDALKASDKDRYGRCVSVWAQLGTISWFLKCLETSGRYQFLEAFTYRYAYHQVSPKYTRVPELEEKRRNEWRPFEVSVLKERRIWSVFLRLARGTPYAAFFKSHASEIKTYRQIIGEAFPDLEVPREAFSHHVAELFFNAARSEMARHAKGDEKHRPDHPKILEMLREIEEREATLKHGRMLIKTETRRHTGYLREVLGHYAHEDVVRKPGSATGSRIGRIRRRRKSDLRGLKTGESNALVGTSLMAEGHDIPRALFAIVYVTATTYPIEDQQFEGRLGRAGEAVDCLRLVTSGAEALRNLIARLRRRRMNRGARELSRTLWDDGPPRDDGSPSSQH